MNELELLKKLFTLEQKQHALEIRIGIVQEKQITFEIREEISNLGNEISKIQELLINVKDKSHSQKATVGMMRQLNSYITEINKAKDGLKLSRNQGLILENFLFSEILRDLKAFLISETFGSHIPINLKYTYSDKDSVEILDLANFLAEQKELLKQLEDPNYVKLRSFYEEFKNKMMNRFIKNN